MSTCIKDLYDYDLVKKCRVCKNVLLKSNFSENTKSRDELQSRCKCCVNDYNKNFYNLNRDSELERRKKYNSQNHGKINEYIKNRMKTDLNFKLSSYMRNRFYKTYKAKMVERQIKHLIY